MHMMENARFMAERLHAEFPHEVSERLASTVNAQARQYRVHDSKRSAEQRVSPGYMQLLV